MCVIYLFIYHENHTQSTVIKKEKTRNTLVDAKCPLRTLEVHFVRFAGHSAKADSLIMDIVRDVLIHFPIIAQRSKGVHYFHRVVGLEVINIRQWARPIWPERSLTWREEWPEPFQKNGPNELVSGSPLPAACWCGRLTQQCTHEHKRKRMVIRTDRRSARSAMAIWSYL